MKLRLTVIVTECRRRASDLVWKISIGYTKLYKTASPNFIRGITWNRIRLAVRQAPITDVKSRTASSEE
jgi:hypothetical protein